VGWTPFPEIREGRIRGDSFVVKLWDVHRGRVEGVDERYRDAKLFFDRTYFSPGLRRFLGNALRRTAGRGGDPVVLLYTGFGGGKSHALLAVYHALRNTERSLESPRFRGFLDEEGLEPPKAGAAIAVFDGAALDPVSLQRTYGVESPWEFILSELASQAGDPGAAERLRRLAGEYSREPPGYEALADILEILEGSGPAPVVLLDDLGVYIEGLIARGRESEARAFTVFLYNLAMAVSNTGRAFLAVATPQQFREASGMIVRVMQSVARVARGESIVGPRDAAALLKSSLLEAVDEDEAERVASRYSRLYEESRSLLPAAAASPSYREELARGYPFHPMLVGELYGGVAQLEGVQGTRDVLRLTAWLLHHAYRLAGGEPRDMLLPGDVDPGLGGVAEVLSSSPQARRLLEAARYDLDEVAARIDDERIGRGLPRLARPVYAAVLLRSLHGGELRDDETRLATASPLRRIEPAHVDPVLEKLAYEATHLHWREDGGHKYYSVRVSANLNVVIEREAKHLLAEEPELVRGEAVARLRDVAGGGWARVVVWPRGPGEVVDDRKVKLVFLDPAVVERVGLEKLVAEYARYSKPGGAQLRKHVNTLVFLEPDPRAYEDLLGAVAELLAVERLRGRAEELKLSRDDLALLDEHATRAGKRARDAAVSLYTRVYYPVGMEGTRISVANTELKASTVRARRYSGAVEEALVDAGKLAEVIDPEYVLEVIKARHAALGGPVDFSAILDAFTTDPSKPMLKDPYVALRNAIKKLLDEGLVVPADETGVPRCETAPSSPEEALLLPCSRSECCPEVAEPEPVEESVATVPVQVATPSQPRRREVIFEDQPAEVLAEKLQDPAPVEFVEATFRVPESRPEDASRLAKTALLVVQDLARALRSADYRIELDFAANVESRAAKARLQAVIEDPEVLATYINSMLRSMLEGASRAQAEVRLYARRGGARLVDLAQLGEAFKRASIARGRLRVDFRAVTHD